MTNISIHTLVKHIENWTNAPHRTKYSKKQRMAAKREINLIVKNWGFFGRKVFLFYAGRKMLLQ